MSWLKEKGIDRTIISAIVRRLRAPHFKVFYFGSRVSGKASERSDIDVGIDAQREVPAAVLFEVKDELDNLPIMQKIDLVDFNNVSDSFKEVALQDIRVIYEK